MQADLRDATMPVNHEEDRDTSVSSCLLASDASNDSRLV